MSRYDAALIPGNFEVDTQAPVHLRCAHWPRCPWGTDFDGDDVVRLWQMVEAAQRHLDAVHSAEREIEPIERGTS